jgi:hypothetical protein
VRGFFGTLATAIPLAGLGLAVPAALAAQEPAPASAPTAAATAEAPPPLIATGDFAGRAAFWDAQISPDGSMLSFLRKSAGETQFVIADIVAKNRAWPMEQRRYLIDTDEAAFPFTLPLRAGEEAEPVLGWLVVGRRRDDTLINVDEREVLAGLSAPLARALMLIEARDEEKRVLADRFNQLERAVSAIMSRLTPPSHPPAAHP